MMNLKEKKLKEAKEKLAVLEEKLRFLKFSNVPDRDVKIIDCEHAIEKQKTIVSNTEIYLKNQTSK